MGVYVNDNGTLRNCTRAFVNDNGTLREVQRFSVNDNGTLRHIFMKQVDFIDQSPLSIKIDPTDAFAGFRINSDGSIDLGNNVTVNDTYSTDGGTWLIAGAAGDYKASLHQNSGDALTTNAGLDTELNLGTTRSWGYFNNSGLDVLQGNFTLTVKRVSDSVTIDTATITIYAEVTA